MERDTSAKEQIGRDATQSYVQYVRGQGETRLFPEASSSQAEVQTPLMKTSQVTSSETLYEGINDNYNFLPNQVVLYDNVYISHINSGISSFLRKKLSVHKVIIYLGI